MPCVEILKTLEKCRNQIRPGGFKRPGSQPGATLVLREMQSGGRLTLACIVRNDENFAGGTAEDWDGVIGPVVVQRAVTSGVIAPVTRGRTISLFSITTVHSAPDFSRQFVSSRLRAPSISLGLATQ